MFLHRKWNRYSRSGYPDKTFPLDIARRPRWLCGKRGRRSNSKSQAGSRMTLRPYCSDKRTSTRKCSTDAQIAGRSHSAADLHETRVNWAEYNRFVSSRKLSTVSSCKNGLPFYIWSQFRNSLLVSTKRDRYLTHCVQKDYKATKPSKLIENILLWGRELAFTVIHSVMRRLRALRYGSMLFVITKLRDILYSVFGTIIQTL